MRSGSESHCDHISACIYLSYLHSEGMDIGAAGSREMENP